jgi:glycosyltransferase involved in cell wall biosynthesis
MNIGIDIRPLMSPIRTGVGEYTFELLNAIFELETEHQYFLFYNSHRNLSKNIPKWNQPNIHYIPTNYPNKLFNFILTLTSFPKLDSLIKKRLTLPHLDIFFSPNLNFTALSSKTKYILTIHDLSFEFFPEFYSLKQRLWHRLINIKKQCHRANLILTPSENTKQDLIKHYQITSEKIKVIYPGLSENFKQTLTNQTELDNMCSKFKTTHYIPPHFILSFGTIEPRKNILGLIKAFESFKYQSTQHSSYPFPDYHLVIAGSEGWKNQAIFEYLTTSPYKNSIHTLGAVSPLEKAVLYSLADLFVYPSFYEGFGFPILEAFAAKIPIIASNRSSLPEVTENTAYLINPHRPEEIAVAMNTILSHENIKSRLITEGYQQLEKFTWQKAAEKWLKTIKEL